MKPVLHIIGSLDVGGTEKQLALLLPELKKKIPTEVVCLFGHGPIGQVLEQQGVRVHYLKGSGNSDLRVPWRLYLLLHRQQPDIIITYLFYADIIGRLIGRLAGVKTIIQSHRSHLFGPSWWHYLNRFTRFLVTHHVCQTKSIQSALHDVIKIPTSHITIIPNTVADIPTPAFSSSKATIHRRHYSISPDDLVITCVANLKPEKDLPLLLRAFESLSHKYTNLHLWLIGEGPRRPNLEQQIQSYTSRQQIYFLGLQPKVTSYLSESDIFVLPTHTEGMSNALLEAMAAGLPCVTTAIPANQELITSEDTGFLFPVSNQQALEDTLSSLIQNPSLRQAVGRRACNYIQNNHRLEHITQQWQILIQNYIHT